MISAKVRRLIAIGSTLAMVTAATIAAAPESLAARRPPADIINYYNAAGDRIQNVVEASPTGCVNQTPPTGAVTATFGNSTLATEDVYSGTCSAPGSLLVAVPVGQTLTFTNPGTGSLFLPWCRVA
jgi:hypothetical protein